MTDSTHELWKPIAGTDGRYAVSNIGRVRSEHSTTITPRGFKHTKQERIRKMPNDSFGRPRVTLRFSDDTKYTLTVVAHLVAEAFIGPRPDGMMLCHSNGDPADNRVSNLRFDTQSANTLDAVRHGTNHNGSKTHCIRGHEFTPENTWPRLNRVGRSCRQCSLDRGAARYRRKLAERSGA